MKNLLIFIFVFCIQILNAQTFEIRTIDKGSGLIGVEMRETSGTPPSSSDFLTDMVFGIKWLNSYNVDLTNITNSGYNIIKSGIRQTNGNYHFQAFAANATPFNLPSDWTINIWTEIMSISNNQAGMGTGDFEICEIGFDATTEPNIGINLMDYTPTINGSAMNVALPVEWLKFYALKFEEQIELNWSVALEVNNDYFEIQKSVNGVDWENIGHVNSKGNTNEIAHYTFLDKNPYPVNYYRLKQVDEDHQFEYSEIILIEFENISNIKLKVYPNPALDILNIELAEIIENPIIQIFDIQGKKIQININNSSTNNWSLNTNGLSKGYYILRIQHNNTSIIKQFEVF